jgi:hypothetical protein
LKVIVIDVKASYSPWDCIGDFEGKHPTFVEVWVGDSRRKRLRKTIAPAMPSLMVSSASAAV